MAITSAKPASNYRWIICGLLFVITTINYMDRNILGVLKPTIQGDLHFTETDFGNIIFFFSIAYAIGYAGMGWLTDKIGILGGAISSVAGAFSAAVIGRVLDATGNNYTVVFFACASVYVIAAVIIHFILPRRRASMVAVPTDIVTL